MQVADNDRAGAAVAFRTAFLGACQALCFPEIFEHSPRWIAVADFLNLSRQYESNGVMHRLSATRPNCHGRCYSQMAITVTVHGNALRGC